MDHPFSPIHYLRLLRRRWRLILIPTLIALLTAALLSFLTPVHYTAAATLLAPSPQLVWRWENKVSDVVDTRFDWRAEILPLLTTTNLSERGLAKVGDQLQHPLDAATLAGRTKARVGAGSLFTLQVRAASAGDAQLLANALAEALTEAAADYYSGDLAANQAALQETLAQFQVWDDALTAFRARSGMGLGMSGAAVVLNEEEVIALQSAVKQEMALANSRRAALQHALGRVQMVLDAGAAGEPLPRTLLNVPEINAIYALPYDEALQLPAGELLARLREIAATMQRDYDLLSQQAIAAQQETSELTTEWENILRDRGVWLESVTAIQRREVELQMKRLIEGSRVRLIDPAPLPERPSQPNWPLNLGLALAGGLLFGFLLAVAAVYFGEDPL